MDPVRYALVLTTLFELSKKVDEMKDKQQKPIVEEHKNKRTKNSK